MTDGPVLIIGASRGIGAELVRQYRAVDRFVVATVRTFDPETFPIGPDPSQP